MFYRAAHPSESRPFARSHSTALPALYKRCAPDTLRIKRSGATGVLLNSNNNSRILWEPPSTDPSGLKSFHKVQRNGVRESEWFYDRPTYSWQTDGPKQTDRPTKGQKDRQTDKQGDGQIDILTGRRSDRQTGWHTDRQTDWQVVCFS